MSSVLECVEVLGLPSKVVSVRIKLCWGGRRSCVCGGGGGGRLV